jgi:hypothetical protein
MFNSSFRPLQLPIPLSEGWIANLPARLKLSLLASAPGVFLAKFHAPSDPSPSALKHFAYAQDSLAPRSLGVDRFVGRQVFYSALRKSVLLVFWLPEDGSPTTFVSNLTTTKPLPRRFTGNVSSDYEEIEIAEPAPESRPKSSKRQEIRRARQDISHVFPGIVRIVYSPAAGTLKTSFSETKLHSILKHRELYAKTLARHGIEVNPEKFTVGTWRYDAGSGKKNLYHVLTFEVATAEERGILCTFKPIWKRVVRPKTDEEIDRELNALLSNREALIKRLGIKTTTKL